MVFSPSSPLSAQAISNNTPHTSTIKDWQGISIAIRIDKKQMFIHQIAMGALALLGTIFLYTGYRFLGWGLTLVGLGSIPSIYYVAKSRERSTYQELRQQLENKYPNLTSFASIPAIQWTKTNQKIKCIIPDKIKNTSFVRGIDKKINRTLFIVKLNHDKKTCNLFVIRPEFAYFSYAAEIDQQKIQLQDKIFKITHDKT